MTAVATNPASRSDSSGPGHAILSRYLVPGTVGIVLACLKIVSPLFGNVIFFGFEIVVFGLVAAYFARRPTRPWWLSATLIAAPAFLWTLFGVGFLGPAKLSEGVGIGWLISLALIPISAMTGAYITRRMYGFDH